MSTSDEEQDLLFTALRPRAHKRRRSIFDSDSDSDADTPSQTRQLRGHGCGLQRGHPLELPILACTPPTTDNPSLGDPILCYSDESYCSTGKVTPPTPISSSPSPGDDLLALLADTDSDTEASPEDRAEAWARATTWAQARTAARAKAQLDTWDRAAAGWALYHTQISQLWTVNGTRSIPEFSSSIASKTRRV